MKLALEQDVLTSYSKTHFVCKKPALWFIDVMLVGVDQETGRRETQHIEFDVSRKCRLSDLIQPVSDVINEEAALFNRVFVCYMQVYTKKKLSS